MANVTVQAYTQISPAWPFAGTTAKLRIFASKTFITSEDETVVGGSAFGGMWSTDIDCTIVGGHLHIPSFAIDSTTDGNPEDAKYYAVLINEAGLNCGNWLTEFSVPAIPSTVSWTYLRQFNFPQIYGSLDTIPPGTVTDLTANAAGSTVTLNYTPTVDVGGTVAGVEYRIDGGSWVDRGNISPPYDVLSVPVGLHTFEVREYDNATPPNFASPSNVASCTVLRDLDPFSPVNARWFDLDLVRSDYAGPLAQVSISGTPTDLNTRAEVIAAAAHSYLLLRVYAQDGSGDFMVPIGGTTPILKQSTQDGKPCWYGGVMGLATFNNWNGRTHVNVVVASRAINQTSNILFSGGPLGLKQMYGAFGQWYVMDNGLSSYAFYSNAWTRNHFGSVHRYHYDGSQSTDALKLQIHVNHISRSGSDATSSAGPVPSTFTNATGFYIGGANDGTSQKDEEYFGAYYFGYNIDSTWTTLKDHVGSRLFATTTSQVFFSGDSLTESYNLNGIDPTHTYPSQVITSVQALTGRTWTRLANGVIAEVAAPISRIKQLANAGGMIAIDDWCLETIAVCTAGTNDIGEQANGESHTFTADPATNIITTSAPHNSREGVPVRVTNSGGALPGGLVAGHSYYPQIIDATHYKLANTAADLTAGISVDITDAGTGTHTVAHTVDGLAVLMNSVELAKEWFDFGVDRVIFDNMTPAFSGDGFEAAFATGRGQYNSNFDATFASLVPAAELIHFGTDSMVSDPTDSAWYFDGVHGTLDFYTRKALFVRNQILHDHVPPISSFTVDVSEDVVPLTVNFTDTSSPAATSWAWNFGDGGTSTVQNPSHTFLTPGTYDVTLIASNSYGTGDTFHSTVIADAPELANVDIPHLFARWKATSSDIKSLANGADVPSWADFSGNGHNATVSTSNKPKKSVVSGVHSVIFNEADHIFMPFASPTAIADMTIFVVASTTSEGSYISGATDAVGFDDQLSHDRVQFVGHFSLLTGTNANGSGVKYIKTMTFKSSTGDITLRSNGAANGSTNVGAWSIGAPLSEIGSAAGGTGAWMDGHTYEIIVCNAILTGPEIAAVEDALNSFHHAF